MAPHRVVFSLSLSHWPIMVGCVMISSHTSLLGYIAESCSCATVGNMASLFVGLMAHWSGETREAAASGLVRLAGNGTLHYMLQQCNLPKYPAETPKAISAVIPSLVELIPQTNSSTVTSTMVHLSKHGTLWLNINHTCLICAVGLHAAIGGVIPRLLQFFTYSGPDVSPIINQEISARISSDAATLISTLAEHCESLRN
jgi:hypothetical protein